jgi:hypothetical protein
MILHIPLTNTSTIACPVALDACNENEVSDCTAAPQYPFYFQKALTSLELALALAVD